MPFLMIYLAFAQSFGIFFNTYSISVGCHPKIALVALRVAAAVSVTARPLSYVHWKGG